MTAHSRKLPDRTFHLTRIDLEDTQEELPQWKLEDVELRQIQWKSFEASKEEMKTIKQDLEKIQGIQWNTTTGTSVIIPSLILGTLALYLIRKYKRRQQPPKKDDQQDIPETPATLEDSRHPWLRSSN